MGIALVLFVAWVACGAGDSKSRDLEGQKGEKAELATEDAIEEYLKELWIQSPSEEAKAADFMFSDLEGKTVRLSDFKDKVVFLHFWATWCGPCRAELPAIQKLYDRFKDRKGFALLAVSGDRKGPNVIRPFMQRMKLTIPVFWDSKGQGHGLYGVRSIPTTYLIDRSGRVIGRAVGARRWDEGQARELIEILLEQESDAAEVSGPGDGSITPEQVYAERKLGKEFLLIDARTPAEFESGHLEGAVNIPLNEIEAKARTLDKNQRVVVYCRTNRRSAIAAKKLVKLGVRDVRYMQGGISTWTYEVVK